MPEQHDMTDDALKSAFLILNSQVHPLERDLTNIGRKLDNHVVISDTRVSRKHAQVRRLNGQYLLVDLNSTGGTRVNGEAVDKCILYSGDSISLAGVELKFVQDTPSAINRSLDRTGPMNTTFEDSSPNPVETSDDDTSQTLASDH